ncbi:hypothetical protein NP493_1430g00000, partial [Ridgeia piscesae]
TDNRREGKHSDAGLPPIKLHAFVERDKLFEDRQASWTRQTRVPWTERGRNKLTAKMAILRAMRIHWRSLVVVLTPLVFLPLALVNATSATERSTHYRGVSDVG